MIRALWTATTGMLAQQLQVDTVAHNLANVSTAGFKRSEVSFQDLAYQSLAPARSQGQAEAVAPLLAGEVGHGVQPVASRFDLRPGSLIETGQPWDWAVMGEGFFQVRRGEDGIAYRRDGRFGIDAEGYVVDPAGNRVLDVDEEPIQLDAEQGIVDVTLDPDGTLRALYAGEEEAEEVAVVGLARFAAPAALERAGDNLWLATEAAGEVVVEAPGTEGLGRVRQGALEGSNVEVAQEMVTLIAAQRAYELTARAIQAADEMMSLANNLRA